MGTTINAGALESLINALQDDPLMLGAVYDAVVIFEEYHSAVIAEQALKLVYEHGVATPEYRERYTDADATRTRVHNAVIARVALLNREAEKRGIAPIYKGEVSTEYPARRELADAVMAYLETIVENRS